MARALIQYKQRREREKEARDAGKRAAKGAHRGETAALVVSTVTVEGGGDGREDGAEVVLGVVLRVPRAASEEEARRSATTHAYWHAAVGRPPGGESGAQTVGMRGLLEEMDGAQRVVMLGGTEAEQAWGAMYEGDSERAEAHRAKMVIMGEETARACGRRVARSELLRANGERTGLGEEEDTPRWWWDGRLQAVLRACRREARALARIAIAAEARLPGKQTTTAVSIRATVLRGEKRGAETDDGRERAVAQRAGTRGAEEEREGSARTRGEKRRQQNNNPPEQADGTPQRQRTEVQSYDEMKRRGTRKRKVTYLVTDGQRAGAKRDSMAAGAATLDRTVGQRYEWRDGGLAEAKRRRGGLYGGARDGA